MSCEYSDTTHESCYKRVFVALDGTAAQIPVLQRAIHLACSNRAELYIGHVIDSASLETADTEMRHVIDEKKTSFLTGISQLLADVEKDEAIAHVETIIKVGRVRETLKDEMIAVINPDVVVCGARGLSALQSVFSGSVSTFLLRNSGHDVLVVK